MRDLKFKVGIQISEDGTLEKSRGLRHVSKMRELLQYKPGTKEFNIEEVNEMMNKAMQYKKDLGIVKSNDKELDTQKSKDKLQKFMKDSKKKDRYRDRYELEKSNQQATNEG